MLLELRVKDGEGQTAKAPCDPMWKPGQPHVIMVGGG